MGQTNRVRLGAAASAVGGAAFIPYALSKGHASELILQNGWQLAGLSPRATSNVLHLTETVPMVLMALGLFAVAARYDFYGPGYGRYGGMLVRAGVAIAIFGFAATTVIHAAEHLLPAFVVPALTGDANWFLWGYYLGWLTLQSGLFVVGAAWLLSGRDSGPIPWIFVAALPVTAVIGFGVVFADVFTFAGTQRSVTGLTWVVAGTWLWRMESGGLAPVESGEREDDRPNPRTVSETDAGD